MKPQEERMGVPSFFEHYCPTKILAGQRAVSNLPFEMARFGQKRALLVMDGAVASSGFQKLVEQAFTDSDRTIGAVFPDANAPATLRTAKLMAGVFTAGRCDCFVVAGGASAMDSAKGAAILAASGSDALPADVPKKLAPIFAIPVTYAEGYPVTDTAELLDEEKNAPAFVKDEGLMPLMAVLDPKAALKTTPGARAAYAMDALAKAVEAYVQPEYNPVVGIYAKASIEMVRKYLAPASNEATRSKVEVMALANAALYAGIAFTHASTGIIASAAYALGKVSGIETGTASAILLPHGIDFYAGPSGDRVAELAGVFAGSTRFLSEGKGAGVIKDAANTLRKISGLPESLSEAGVIKPMLAEAAKAAASGSCPYHSAAFSAQDVQALLEKAF
jgi:alcohol dehydrogenase